MIPLREKDIQRTVCDFLRAEGWRVFEFEQQFSEKKRKTVGERGMPDVLAIRYGPRMPKEVPIECRILHEVIWIELKTPRGRASEAQKYWIALERDRGALVWLAGEDFPATIEGFIAHYRRFHRSVVAQFESAFIG